MHYSLQTLEIIGFKHWSVWGKKREKKSAKMSFGTYIHSLQSSVFARRKRREKKMLQRQGNGLLFVFSLKLSQKAK